MYYLIYRKQIIILTWVLFVIFMIFISIYLYWKNINPVKNLKTNFSWSELTIDSNSIWLKSKYDFLQIYVYPNNFDLDCTSKNDDYICPNLKNTLKTIDNYIWFKSVNLKNNIDEKLVVNLDLWESKNDKIFLSSLLVTTQMWLNNKEKNKSWYEKYFDFKNIDENEIVLNEMEIICATQAESLYMPWDYMREDLIKNYILENCSNFWNINSLDIAYWNKELIWEKNIDLNLKIKSYVLKFQYFDLAWGEYKIKKEATKIVDSEYIIKENINISDLLSN